jgi:hypothetical protein
VSAIFLTSTVYPLISEAVVVAYKSNVEGKSADVK